MKNCGSSTFDRVTRNRYSLRLVFKLPNYPFTKRHHVSTQWLATEVIWNFTGYNLKMARAISLVFRLADDPGKPESIVVTAYEDSPKFSSTGVSSSAGSHETLNLLEALLGSPDDAHDELEGIISRQSNNRRVQVVDLSKWQEDALRDFFGSEI